MEPTKQDNHELTMSEMNQQSSFWSRFGKKAVIYSGVTALVGMYGIPAVFGWIGFSSIGVTAGSLAAWWQATHFAPSIFALMQSATATGTAGALVTKVGVGSAVMKAYYDAKMKNQNEAKVNSDEQTQPKP
jgi:hypothetical protein